MSTSVSIITNKSKCGSSNQISIWISCPCRGRLLTPDPRDDPGHPLPPPQDSQLSVLVPPHCLGRCPQFSFSVSSYFFLVCECLLFDGSSYSAPAAVYPLTFLVWIRPVLPWLGSPCPPCSNLISTQQKDLSNMHINPVISLLMMLKCLWLVKHYFSNSQDQI